MNHRTYGPCFLHGIRQGSTVPIVNWFMHKTWLVVWNIFYFSIDWEVHHPNWRIPSFFRGVGQPPTKKLVDHCSEWWIVDQEKMDLGRGWQELWIEAARCLSEYQWINGSIPNFYNFLGDGKMDHVPPKQSRTWRTWGVDPSIYPPFGREKSEANGGIEARKHDLATAVEPVKNVEMVVGSNRIYVLEMEIFFLFHPVSNGWLSIRLIY